MSCKFNPVVSTTNIKYPRQWCNILWGYCQFQTDDFPNICPLYALGRESWIQYWVEAQDDDSKIVYIKTSSGEYEITIGELKKIISSLEVNGINIEYESSSDRDKIIAYAMKTGYLTVYDGDDLISVGQDAFTGLPKLETIDLHECLYIGSKAFFGQDNLKIVDFSQKTDDFIPILANINAFYRSDMTINRNIEFVVPSRLLSAWKSSPNWQVYESQIVGS